jgi:hypothetical protein
LAKRCKPDSNTKSYTDSNAYAYSMAKRCKPNTYNYTYTDSYSYASPFSYA